MEPCMSSSKIAIWTTHKLLKQYQSQLVLKLRMVKLVSDSFQLLIIDSIEAKDTPREKIVKHMQAAIEDFNFDVYYPNEETNYRSF